MLIIIESPGKKKSIAKYTGAKVMATFGHFKDLPKKTMGFNTTDFEPTFVAESDGSKRTIAQLKKMAKGETVYIATDQDREGDAIAAFVYEEIKNIAPTIYRTVFGEITEKVVKESLKNSIPFEQFDWKKYEAFLGRRLGDRLCGYTLSPIMKKETRWEGTGSDGMSVGRVQTISVKAIVDKEREILDFKPQPYINLKARTATDVEFEIMHEDNKFFDLNKAESIFQKIENQKEGKVEEYDAEKERTSNAPAPFITSSLQTEASSRLKLPPKVTMELAQKLYEGFGDGGFITYMRTDSTKISQEYLDIIKVFLEKAYPNDFTKTKQHASKKSQAEAHECIRPSKLPETLERDKEKIVAGMLNIGKPDAIAKKTAQLYELILRRTLASQMDPAIYKSPQVLISIEGENFKASGSTLIKKGFLSILPPKAQSKDKILPPMKVGEIIPLSSVEKIKGETEPPPRYTEPSLIKFLEKEGIGRPSTYASIMSILTDKKFSTKDKDKFVPTQKAFILIDKMMEMYPMIVDYKFTANMEKDLDTISNGEETWKNFMTKFFNAMGRPEAPVMGPTIKMKDIIKKISEKGEIEVDPKVYDSFELASNWLTEHISNDPTEGQIRFAKQLEARGGGILNNEILLDRKKITNYIDKAKKKAVFPLTDAQKGVLMKCLDPDDPLLETLDNEEVENLKKLKKALDKCFKNFKKK